MAKMQIKKMRDTDILCSIFLPVEIILALIGVKVLKSFENKEEKP